MSRDITPADEAARLARLRDEQGLPGLQGPRRQGLRPRPGPVARPDRGSSIPAVRKAVGDEVALLADGNSCYTPAEGHRGRPAAGGARLLPLRGALPLLGAGVDGRGGGGAEDARGRRRAGQRPGPVAADDPHAGGGHRPAGRLLRRRPDPGAARGRAWPPQAGLPCVPHSANLSMVTVFTLHLMGAIPNAGPHVEFTIEPSDWATDLYRPGPGGPRRPGGRSPTARAGA